jgi:hypothetical protein
MLPGMTARGWATAGQIVSQNEAPEAEEPSASAGRARGRSGVRNDPTIDWEAIENAYVWGDTLGQREDGSYVRKYPTFKQLGEKFKVSGSLVHYYAKKQKWLDRRLAVQAKTKQELDEALVKSRVLETVNASSVLDVWLRKFRDNVNDGKVPAVSITDLNTVVRLQKFLAGEGDTRTEMHVHLTLDALHARHAAMRARVGDASGEVAGELPPGEDPAITGDVPEVSVGADEDEPHAGDVD